MLTRSRVVRIPMTKDEYFRQAEIRENCILDWEDGEAIQGTPAHSRHRRFISYLYLALDRWLAKKKTGEAFNEVFVDFGKKTFGVDVAVLFKEHSDRHREGRLSGAPDIVAEIVSDDSSTRDRIDKFKAYWEYQVPWYWIGDPTAGTLEEYQWTAQGYVRTSEGSLDNPFEPRALPGLKVDMATLVE